MTEKLGVLLIDVPEPDYEAADQLVRTKDHVNFAGLAGIFAGFNMGE